MAEYCSTHGVELAPHGKTTMAPQLWRRQLDAGAWGISAATVAQARVMIAAGVQRVMIANEVTDEPARCDGSPANCVNPTSRSSASVDSPEAVQLLAHGLGSTPRALPVLVELGHPGGRTGAAPSKPRSRWRGLVRTEPRLALARRDGLRGNPLERPGAGCLDAVRAFLDDLGALTARLRSDGLVETEATTVSAGGSTFFDLVVEQLPSSSGGAADGRLLRSGRYVTHDSGEHERASPFADREPARRFHAAIEAWGAVLARPGPDVAIVNFGRRDVPFDQQLPMPFEVRRHGGARIDVSGGVVVEKLNDQHAYCRVVPGVRIEPGDLVGCGVSHACSAFDRWRVMPVLDDDDHVIDAVATYF